MHQERKQTFNDKDYSRSIFQQFRTKLKILKFLSTISKNFLSRGNTYLE